MMRIPPALDAFNRILTQLISNPQNLKKKTGSQDFFRIPTHLKIRLKEVKNHINPRQLIFFCVFFSSL